MRDRRRRSLFAQAFLAGMAVAIATPVTAQDDPGRYTRWIGQTVAVVVVAAVVIVAAVLVVRLVRRLRSNPDLGVDIAANAIRGARKVSSSWRDFAKKARDKADRP